MKFSDIKTQIKNLGSYKTLTEIKKSGLRICKNSETGDYWLIEEEFLKPIIFSLKELKRIDDDMNSLQYNLLYCHTPKKDLKEKHVLEYINWGEKQRYHCRPTCKCRELWFSIGEDWRSAPIVFPAKVGERMLVLFNSKGIFEDKKLYGITPKPKIESWLLCAILNSTLTRFFMDLSCRQLTGAQAIADIDVNIVENLFIVWCDDLHKRQAEIKSAFNKLKDRAIGSHIGDEYGLILKGDIRQQEPNPLPDRKELDDIIFDILGLTKEERKEVYWAVCELVKNRLEKAKSV